MFIVDGEESLKNCECVFCFGMFDMMIVKISLFCVLVYKDFFFLM